MVSTVIARVQGPQRRKAANRRSAACDCRGRTRRSCAGSICGSARRRVSPT